MLYLADIVFEPWGDIPRAPLKLDILPFLRLPTWSVRLAQPLVLSIEEPGIGVRKEPCEDNSVLMESSMRET